MPATTGNLDTSLLVYSVKGMLDTHFTPDDGTIVTTTVDYFFYTVFGMDGPEGSEDTQAKASLAVLTACVTRAKRVASITMVSCLTTGRGSKAVPMGVASYEGSLERPPVDGDND